MLYKNIKNKIERVIKYNLTKSFNFIILIAYEFAEGKLVVYFTIKNPSWLLPYLVEDIISIHF